MDANTLFLHLTASTQLLTEKLNKYNKIKAKIINYSFRV